MVIEYRNSEGDYAVGQFVLDRRKAGPPAIFEELSQFNWVRHRSIRQRLECRGGEILLQAISAESGKQHPTGRGCCRREAAAYMGLEPHERTYGCAGDVNDLGAIQDT